MSVVFFTRVRIIDSDFFYIYLRLKHPFVNVYFMSIYMFKDYFFQLKSVNVLPELAQRAAA